MPDTRQPNQPSWQHGKMWDETGLRSETLCGIGAISKAEWTACFSDEAEGWDYYVACERGAGPEMKLGAVAVYDERGLVAAVPTFETVYRLDTPFQGRWKWADRGIGTWLRNIVTLKLFGVGSPFTEQCHIAIRPKLEGEQKARAIDKLIETIEAQANATGTHLIAFKDLTPADTQTLSPILRTAGFFPIQSLPVARLNLLNQNLESYMRKLSPSTRKDARRKLKSRSEVRVEYRSNIDDIEDLIISLYESTRRHSHVQYGEFEELPQGYFREVARAEPGRVRFVLYWIGDRLAAFNLLLVQSDRLIDKFLGMSYPIAVDHNLYILSWFENVCFALDHGYASLQAGQTAYPMKVRLGSELIPCMVFAKHRQPLLNGFMRLIAPYMAFDRWDPGLRALRTAGKITAVPASRSVAQLRS